ncbi:CatB-related O-acetyltransferase [Novosphingobium flavum]|nr:CatB-related O-acetyltransferase [Novosphingobium aerophilum]
MSESRFGPMKSCRGWRRKVLQRVYRDYRLDRLFEALIARWEGGPYQSGTWRELLSQRYGVRIGAYSYGPILDRTCLTRGSSVGNWCSVGRGLIVRRRNHPLDRVTQHPLFYNAKLGNVPADTIPANEDNPLTIGHDVWIGDRVTILSACRSIGNGAVISAGAVVTKDVPPYAIVVGVPGRVLRPRYPEPVQNALEQSRWWEFDLASLRELGDFLQNPLTEERTGAFLQACDEIRQSRT